jgi:hypothetical protein
MPTRKYQHLFILIYLDSTDGGRRNRCWRATCLGNCSVLYITSEQPLYGHLNGMRRSFRCCRRKCLAWLSMRQSFVRW